MAGLIPDRLLVRLEQSLLVVEVEQVCVQILLRLGKLVGELLELVLKRRVVLAQLPQVVLLFLQVLVQCFDLVALRGFCRGKSGYLR